VAKREISTQSLPHEVVKACLMVRRSKMKKRKEGKENERAYGKVALFLQSMQWP